MAFSRQHGHAGWLPVGKLIVHEGGEEKVVEIDDEELVKGGVGEKEVSLPHDTFTISHTVEFPTGPYLYFIECAHPLEVPKLKGLSSSSVSIALLLLLDFLHLLLFALFFSIVWYLRAVLLSHSLSFFCSLHWHSLVLPFHFFTLFLTLLFVSFISPSNSCQRSTLKNFLSSRLQFVESLVNVIRKNNLQTQSRWHRAKMTHHRNRHPQAKRRS